MIELRVGLRFRPERCSPERCARVYAPTRPFSRAFPDGSPVKEKEASSQNTLNVQ